MLGVSNRREETPSDGARRLLRGRRQGDIRYWGVEGSGSLPFCLAPTIEAHRSAALRTDGLGAMRRVLLTPVPDAEPCTAFHRNQAESEHICDAVTPLTPRVRRGPRAVPVAYKLMSGERSAIEAGPLDEIAFAIVVGDQCDALAERHPVGERFTLAR